MASSKQKNSDPISSDMVTNLNRLKAVFFYPENRDFVIREIHIKAINRTGAILSMTGMADDEAKQKYIIGPLLEETIDQYTEEDIGTALMKRVITGKNLKKVTTYYDIIQRVLNGDTILLIEGYEEAISVDTVGYEHRSVEKPIVENTLLGPKEAFVESDKSNRSLIRKHIKSESLVAETVMVGKKAKDEVYIMYMKDIANPKLVEDVKKRVSQIEVDEIQSLSMLSQHIEERPYSLIPSTLLTERPDRTSAFLMEGHIALLMDGYPLALIIPITFWSLFQTSEDMFQRWAYGNFIRLIRLLSCFIAALTPALYISISIYHIDMVPTDLVLAIAASRERLPFPAIIELIFMEMTFELLREAGVRIPTPIGPTIGIVGALILGQAAVEANVVSPILVIVVAITGLASFAIPEISLSYMIRIGRFLFFIGAIFMGFFGMAAILTAVVAYMCTIKSFDIPFLSPMAPHYRSSKDMIVRPPVWKMWLRPLNVKPQEKVRKKITNTKGK